MLNKRCMDIIEYLRKNSYSFTLKEIAEKFCVSERSIRYDIENINYYLSKFQLKEIEKTSKGIYKLEEDDIKVEKLLSDMSKKFYVFSSEERKEYIKSRFLFFDENKFIDFAEDLDVSISTIKVDLKEIKIFFIENSLELNFISKQGVVLQGNEEKLRMLQLKFLYKYTSIDDNNRIQPKIFNENLKGSSIIYEDIVGIYGQLDLKNIYLFVKRVEKRLKTIISDEGFIYLRFYLMVMINRIKNNFFIESKENNKKFLKETKEYSILEKELELLQELYEIKIDENEILLLTEMFLGAHSYDFNSSFFENWIELETLVNKLIKDLGKVMDIDLSQDKALVDGLLNHLKPAYYRIRNNITFENKIYDDVTTLYGDLYEKVEKISRKYLEKYTGKPIPEEEIAFLTIHFKTAIDRKVNSQRRTKNILIVCGLGYGSSKLLAQKLIEKYDINIIDTIPYHKFLELEVYEEIDFIITTLEIEDRYEYSFPIIKVHPILTKEDRKLLESYGLSENQKKISLKMLLNIIKEESLIRDEKELINKLKKLLKHKYIDDICAEKSPLLSELLPEENILIVDEDIEWKEAIKISGNILVNGEYVEKKYIEEMIKNVDINGSYMVVNERIALPHARIEGLVKKTGMSLLILKNRVIFPGDKKVKVILAFSSIDYKEHIDALTDFVTLLEETNFMELVEETNIEKIRELINRL